MMHSTVPVYLVTGTSFCDMQKSLLESYGLFEYSCICILYEFWGLWITYWLTTYSVCPAITWLLSFVELMFWVLLLLWFRMFTINGHIFCSDLFFASCVWLLEKEGVCVLCCGGGLGVAEVLYVFLLIESLFIILCRWWRWHGSR